ncbi:MAG: hypothetical protein ACR5LA_10585 [Wolbachia sp.]
MQTKQHFQSKNWMPVSSTDRLFLRLSYLSILFCHSAERIHNNFSYIVTWIPVSATRMTPFVVNSLLLLPLS